MSIPSLCAQLPQGRGKAALCLITSQTLHQWTSKPLNLSLSVLTLICNSVWSQLWLVKVRNRRLHCKAPGTSPKTHCTELGGVPWVGEGLEGAKVLPIIRQSPWRQGEE